MNHSQMMGYFAGYMQKQAAGPVTMRQPLPAQPAKKGLSYVPPAPISDEEYQAAVSRGKRPAPAPAPAAPSTATLPKQITFPPFRGPTINTKGLAAMDQRQAELNARGK